MSMWLHVQTAQNCKVWVRQLQTAQNCAKLRRTAQNWEDDSGTLGTFEGLAAWCTPQNWSLKCGTILHFPYCTHTTLLRGVGPARAAWPGETHSAPICGFALDAARFGCQNPYPRAAGGPGESGRAKLRKWNIYRYHFWGVSAFCGTLPASHTQKTVIDWSLIDLAY